MQLYLSRLQVIILSLILAVGATVGSVVFNNASAESEHPALGRVCKPHANQIIEEASFKNATNVQANLS